MAGSIGIKQANGNFYAILEENSDVKKRLILTTVHDNQKSVQIDLYRSGLKSMTDAVYIGSIVVENISLKPRGEPSIEMMLHSTQDGSISAYAVDLANPENEHHLSVSLKSLEEDKNEYPDFEVDETGETRKTETPAYRKKFPWGVIIIAGLLLALLCLALWYFMFRNKPGTATDSSQTAVIGRAQTQTSMVVRQADPQIAQTIPQTPPAGTEASTPPAVQEKPAGAPAGEQPASQTEARKTVVVTVPPKANSQAAARERQSAPVVSHNAPQTIPAEGITYKVTWGDTLWDISEAFYRNPRLYTFIARSNGIRNPNHIVSGTNLTIRPRP